MNEIEKLYKNAGTGKIKIFWCGEYDCLPKEHPQGYQINCFKNCGLCSYTEYKYVYPPFTAEKQIAILQFCLKWGQVHILKGIDNEYRIENSCYRQGYQPTIADALANYINEKWGKLTPKEKQQVKGILE